MSIRRFIDIVQGTASSPFAESEPRRRFQLLLEVAHTTHLLLEDRIEFFRKNYVPRIAKLVPNYDIPRSALPEWWFGAETAPEQRAEWLLQQVIAADPDSKKKNAQWLLNLLLKNLLPWEELERATDLLTQFMEKKREGTIPRDTDLTKLSSLGQLNGLMNARDTEIAQVADSEHQKAMSESDVLLDNAQWLVVSPRTKMAACFFGRQTEWCTAWGDPQGRHPTRSNNMFDHYAQMGPLFIAINKTSNERWQFSPAAKQYMDVNDSPININKWLAENPEPAEALSSYATRSLKDITDKIEGYQSRWRVYLGKNGLSVRSGPEFNADTSFSITVDENRNITSVRGSLGALERFMGPLLNKLQYRGGADNLKQHGIRWSPSKGYGSFGEVAEPFMEFEDGWKWGEVPDGKGTSIGLFNPEGQPVLTGSIEDESFGLNKPVADYLRAAKGAYLPHLVALLRDDDRIARWPRQYSYDYEPINLSGLPKDALAEITARKPEMLTPKVDLIVNGPTEQVRDKISATFTDEGYDEPEWVEVDGKWYAVVATENDAHEAGKAWGNRDMQDFSETVEDGFTSWDFNGDSGMADAGDFLKSLDKDEKGKLILRKIGVAVWNELSEDDQRSVLDDLSDLYDPRNIDHIETAIDTVGEVEWLDDAVRRAVTDGERSGAEGQAITAFREAFTDNPHVFFKTPEGGWSKQFLWDVAVGFLVPIAEIADHAEREEFDTSELPNETLKHSEPHYGFQDYDEEAAEESFRDGIEEYMPDVADDAQIEYPPDDEDEDER